MKITIKQETHMEIIGDKATSDQTTTTEIETEDKELKLDKLFGGYA